MMLLPFALLVAGLVVVPLSTLARWPRRIVGTLVGVALIAGAVYLAVPA